MKWIRELSTFSGNIVDERQHLVATISRTRQADPDANARLIAAAPDLLAALKLVVDGLQLDSDEEISGADAIEYLSANWATLRAAISKAEEGKE